MPRALRAKGAARAQIAGLLAPHRRQGNALHPYQTCHHLTLDSAPPVAVGRERQHAPASQCNGLSLLRGAAYGMHATRAGNQSLDSAGELKLYL